MNKLPKETMPVNKMGVAPIVGGVNTDWDPAQLPLGGYSKAINVREQGPGFTLRPGLSVIDSYGYGEDPYISIFSYGPTNYIYTQQASGIIRQSDDQPPDEYYGYEFGDDVWDPTYSPESPNAFGVSRPGSWSQFREAVLFSGGKGNHVHYAGEQVYPSKIVQVAYEPLTGFPEYVDTEDSFDITEFVTDKSSNNNPYRIDSTFYGHDDAWLMICCDFPAYRWDFEMAVVSYGGDVLGYFFDGLWGWTLMTTGFTDTTGGFGQDGYIRHESPRRRTQQSSIGEQPTWNFGKTGYWYAFAVDISDDWCSFRLITYDGDWDEYRNVPDGEKVYAVEVQVEQLSNDYYTYPGDTIDVGALAINKDVFVGFEAQPLFLLIDPGTTPNITASTVMSLATPDEEDGWATNATTVDLTNGLEQRELVMWDVGSMDTQLKRSINGSLPLFWVRLRFSKLISDDVIISIRAVLKAPPVGNFGEAGLCSTMWKDRACITSSRLPRDIYVSAKNRPCVFNGSDFAILTPGDGRYNDVTAMLPFYNELMVFQNEGGADGGCITLFEGYSPETFGKLVLSTRLGTFNAQSVCIVDGTEGTTRTTDVTQTQVAFISKYGVFMTDGRTIKAIHDPISNYWNPKNDECIIMSNDFGALGGIYPDEDDSVSVQHWIAYDRQSNVLRLGLISGNSPWKYPDIFPVYHLNSGNWTFDEYPNHWLTAFADVNAYEGPDTLQYCAAMQADQEDYYSSVFRSVAGQTWDMDNFTSPYDGIQVSIDGTLRWEFSNGGNYLEIKELVMRSSSEVKYELTKTIYENGTLDSDETETNTMEAAGNDLTYRVRMLESVQLNSHFSIELTWTNTTESGTGEEPVDFGSCPVLYDVVHEINTSRNLD